MRVAHHLTIIGGISSVTTSYRVENPNLLFGVSIKSTHMNLNGNFSNVFLHFKKMAKSSRNVLQTYSEICIFLCDTVTSRSSQWEVLLKVLIKSLKIVSDKVHFIVNLSSFPLFPGSLGKLFLPREKSFDHLSSRTTSKTSPPLNT